MRASAARHRTRTMSAILALTLTGLLGGCSSLPTPSWDPTDLMDFLDTKKPTPGVRKPVFPEGVPGLSQGVPPELVRGSPESRAMAGGDAQAAAPVAEPPPQETRPLPPKRTRAAARRSSPPRHQPQQQPVEVAPDDVNVGEEPARAAPRGYQQQSAPPFPAPLPR